MGSARHTNSGNAQQKEAALGTRHQVWSMAQSRGTSALEVLDATMSGRSSIDAVATTAVGDKEDAATPSSGAAIAAEPR